MCILNIVYFSTFILLACQPPFCVSPSSPLSYVLPVRTRELSVCLSVFLCIISASRKTTRQQFDEGNFQARNLFFTYFDIGSSSSFSLVLLVPFHSGQCTQVQLIIIPATSSLLYFCSTLWNYPLSLNLHLFLYLYLCAKCIHCEFTLFQ